MYYPVHYGGRGTKDDEEAFGYSDEYGYEDHYARLAYERHYDEYN